MGCNIPMAHSGGLSKAAVQTGPEDERAMPSGLSRGPGQSQVRTCTRLVGSGADTGLACYFSSTWPLPKIMEESHCGFGRCWTGIRRGGKFY